MSGCFKEFEASCSVSSLLRASCSVSDPLRASCSVSNLLSELLTEQSAHLRFQRAFARPHGFVGWRARLATFFDTRLKVAVAAATRDQHARFRTLQQVHTYAELTFGAITKALLAISFHSQLTSISRKTDGGQKAIIIVHIVFRDTLFHFSLNTYWSKRDEERTLHAADWIIAFH
jgi:hypothetical protein